MYPRLSLPRKSADPRDGRPSVRARGGVEAVVLSMPEICAALKAIYTLAMTVRLNPEPSDFEAATLAMRAEFGLSASKMQRPAAQQPDSDDGAGPSPAA